MFEHNNEGTHLLSILMPVYNERRTLRTIISRVFAAPIQVPIELVAVDDCSTDGSIQILEELAEADPRIRIFRHQVNQGKGAAIRTAIKMMTGDIAIVQDADLEYNPAEIPVIIEPILNGSADAVFGSRFAGRELRRVLSFSHSNINRILTLCTNLICDLDLTDMETCYKAVRSDILKQTPFTCERFGFEPEISIRLAQWGARIYEVPISYSGRTVAEGKKITWQDGVKAFGVLFKTGVLDTRFTTHAGFYKLKAVRGRALNEWFFERTAPYIGQRIFEAGCGIGNLTEHFLEKESLVCVDIEPLYIEMIARRFSHLENFRALCRDLSQTAQFDFVQNKKVDTVLCLNLLELIDDDEQILKNFYNALEPGGHLILLVPQHPDFYGSIDKSVGHLRRYSAEELSTKMKNAGFEIVKVEDFNRMGGPAWFVSTKFLGSREISPNQMWWFNKLLPVAKLVEHVSLVPAVSLMAVGRKK